MITTFILNVGLATGADTLSARHVEQTLRGVGFTVQLTSVRRSATEPTLVARVTIDDGDMAEALYEASVQLAQDCIAVWCPPTNLGLLIGPNAAAWGEFNPEFFLVFSGKLHAARRERVEGDYQGHLPGSGVQAHSAGGLFPWVVYAQETRVGVKFGFLAPDGTDSGPLYTYGAAVYMAERDKECNAYRVANKARHVAFRKGREAALAAARVVLPDADIGEEPVVEDGARCLLCDHPIPDVPEHKNSIGWFERRDFPETLSNDAWLALYNLLRGN
jgi:hypothetical protein